MYLYERAWNELVNSVKGWNIGGTQQICTEKDVKVDTVHSLQYHIYGLVAALC